MKLKIKVKRFPIMDETLLQSIPEVIAKGDWVDLRASESFIFHSPQAEVQKVKTVGGKTIRYRNVNFELTNIPLGIAMELPKGFEAIVALRSSSPKKFGITMANSIGIIDNSYNGNNDEWKCPVIAFKDSEINVGDRICQFRIQLSQKANFWQKLKWFFSNGIKFIEVDNLNNVDRNGFGSTGNA